MLLCFLRSKNKVTFGQLYRIETGEGVYQQTRYK